MDLYPEFLLSHPHVDGNRVTPSPMNCKCAGAPVVEPETDDEYLFLKQMFEQKE